MLLREDWPNVHSIVAAKAVEFGQGVELGVSLK